MRPARILAALSAAAVLTFGQGVAFGQPIDTPAHVRQIAEAGAHTLALKRVESLQPRDADVVDWFEWERLRLDLLEANGQHTLLVDRVRTYPDGLWLRREALPLLLPAAYAALRSGVPVQARHWLRQWFANVSVDGANFDRMQYRRARRLVVEALFAEGDAESAYRSMLRYQQDFTPLTADEAEVFVAGLLRLNRNSEAAQWLTRLGPRSHYAALVRIRAGLLSPAAAAVQARTALAKGYDVAAIELLEAAAQAQNDRAVLVEVAELRLNGTAPRGADDRSQSAGGIALWRSYEEAAVAGANQAQLLVGDDSGWLAHAQRVRSQQPSMSRALLAYLASKATSAGMRAQAQAYLLAALRDARLEVVAILLFADTTRFRIAALDPRVRHLLGAINADQGRLETAAAYWRGLDAPAGMSAEQWRVHRLAVHAQMGSRVEVQAMLAEMFDDNRAVGEESRRRLLDVARAAFDRNQFQIAEDVLQRLRVRAAASERASVSIALAQVFDATGRPREAADAYLDAALASASPASDRESLQARGAAARSLSRLGMRDDARRIYEWLLRNAKDPGTRESAQHALVLLERGVSASPGR
jgi:hypothetical protein